MLSDDMVSQGVSAGDGLAAVGAEVARVIHMSTVIYTNKNMLRIREKLDRIRNLPWSKKK